MPLSPGALEPLLRVATVPGVGPRRLAALLQRFGSAERVLGAAVADLQALPGFGAEVARRIRVAAEPDGAARARQAIERLQRAGAVALTPDDLAFPDSFRTVSEPPYLVFAIGDLDLLGSPGIAVVGTREPTSYGRNAATDLAAALALAGCSIVSGMARGIDAAAHAAALDAGGDTVGVLGSGIDVVYPTENRQLFARVRANGLLISEYPPGEEPRAGNFPRRNRLIAALGRGVLVVEMAVRSGAQHTVNYALEQGKEIFAVPGPIGSPMSEGTNQLLKEGARVVTTVDDVLEELDGVGTAPRSDARAAARHTTPADPAATPADLPPDEARVLAALSSEPRHADQISAASALPPSRVLAGLLGLELRGIVEAMPGKRFRRV